MTIQPSSALSLALSRMTIEAVWAALGGGTLRRGRGRAFWRDGDGYNVALYLKTNSWRDFASGEGGGLLRLIEVAIGKTRAEAAKWLINFAGVSDISRPLSVRETIDLQERRRQAESQSGDLLEWRKYVIDTLALEAAESWRRYHIGAALIRAFGLDNPNLDMERIADNTESAEQWAETCDRLRDRLKALPMAELVSIWREVGTGRRAA